MKFNGDHTRQPQPHLQLSLNCIKGSFDMMPYACWKWRGARHRRDSCSAGAHVLESQSIDSTGLVNRDTEKAELRSAQVRAWGDRAQCRNAGTPRKKEPVPGRPVPLPAQLPGTDSGFALARLRNSAGSSEDRPRNPDWPAALAGQARPTPRCTVFRPER